MILVYFKIMKIYDYIIHLPNKIFYPLPVKDKKIYENFKKNGYYHVPENEENIKFCRYIEKKINFQKVNQLIELKKNINPNVYSVNITEIFDQKTKDKQSLFQRFKHFLFHGTPQTGYGE